MKTRKFTQGLTMFTTPEMYQDMKKLSDERNISLSELFREMINEYFEIHQGNQHEKNSSKGGK